MHQRTLPSSTARWLSILLVVLFFSFFDSGVNDGPECQASTKVFDITMRGPKVDLVAQYGAGLSLLNPPSLLNTIRNTKSIGISTGAVKETQAYFGVFGNVRANGVGNLSSTLEGQVKDHSK